MVRLPEGVFSAAQRAATILAQEDNPTDRLSDLVSVLEQIVVDPPDDETLLSLLRRTGLKQADRLREVAPSSAKEKKMWAATLWAAIGYAWSQAPEGALSWIELFEKVVSFFGN
jgi:hypothetical protein